MNNTGNLHKNMIAYDETEKMNWCKENTECFNSASSLCIGQNT